MRLITIVVIATLSWASPAAAAVPWSLIAGSKALTPDGRKEAGAAMESIGCYYGCAGTIAKCLAVKPRVRTAWRVASYIIFLARKGLDRKKIAKVIAMRKESVMTGKVHRIVAKGAPRRGPTTAKVVIVEFADYQCGHCQFVHPLLEKMVARFKGSVELVFRPYPLRLSGPNLLAAKASMAAHAQGKFWPMNHLLFANPKQHTPDGIIALAKKAGCDIARFKTALKHRAVLREIDRSKIEGMRAGVRSTPTLFFNGRRYRGRKDLMHMIDRIDEELELPRNR